MQNVFYKNYPEPAGGPLRTVVGIGEPAPPQHWEDQEGAEAICGQGTGEEGQLPGLRESCIGTWGRPQAQRTDRKTEAGSGKPSLQCGNRGHLHHAPTWEHILKHRHTAGRPVAFCGGSLSPAPAQGPQEGAAGGCGNAPPLRRNRFPS